MEIDGYLNLIHVEVSSWYEHGQTREGQAARKRRGTERFLIQTRVFAGQRGGKFFPSWHAAVAVE